MDKMDTHNENIFHYLEYEMNCVYCLWKRKKKKIMRVICYKRNKFLGDILYFLNTEEYLTKIIKVLANSINRKREIFILNGIIDKLKI